MLKYNLQHFGGRGSSGGNAKASVVSRAEAKSNTTQSKFTRTATGISITNSDGTKDIINLTGKRRTAPVNGDAANRTYNEHTRTPASGSPGPSGIDRYVESNHTQVYRTSKGVYEVDFSHSEGYHGKSRINETNVVQAVRKRK